GFYYERRFDGEVQFSWWNPAKDGVTDDGAKFAQAVAYVRSLPGWSASASLGTLKPTLFIQKGVYNLGNAANTVLDFSNFYIRGEGSANTILKYSGTGVLIDIGTYNANPTSLFIDQGSGFKMSGVSITPGSGGTLGDRKGTIIRDNGAGGIKLTDVLIMGYT